MNNLSEKKRKGARAYLLLLTPVALAVFNMPAIAKDYSALRNITAYTPYIINVEKTREAQLKHAPNGLAPVQVQRAYGFDQIANQGAGQTIALVDAFDDPNIESDLGIFSSTFNLPACTTANGCFQKIYASGTQPAGNTGWGTETSLDVEWAHAVAPQAKIILVEAASASLANLFQAIDVAVQKGATAVSMSWGSNEFSTETNYDSTFNVPNITFTASSGDGGHGVIYPSISPYVMSVGGTTLHVDGSGNYLSEAGWSGSGGGFSVYETEPDYQVGFSIPQDPNKLRSSPDISMVADPATGVAVYDTYGHNGWMVIGGTSASSPMVAAMAAIAKASTSNALTAAEINTALYTLAKNNYTALINDIISGSNGSCGVLCTAQVGYDDVTGLGTPKANALIPALSGTTPPPPPGGDRIPI